MNDATATTTDPSPIPDARERILAAAERLFAQKGAGKTSIREITAEAGVNVASVNYYFRSKDALAEALFARLAERATTMRLAELSACVRSAQARSEPVRLEALVACFIRPYFEPAQTGQLFARFILQHRLEPNAMTQRVYEQYLDPFALTFIDALRQTDARVPKAQWIWRYTLMVGTVLLAVTDATAGNRLAKLSQGLADAARGDELERNLTGFLCAALAGSASDYP
jgi:AcrR family transcriptional regulator